MVDVARRLAPDLALPAAAIGCCCASTASTVGGCRTPAATIAAPTTARATAAPLGRGDEEITGIAPVLHGRLE
jgi:hypothetical protein